MAVVVRLGQWLLGILGGSGGRARTEVARHSWWRLGQRLLGILGGSGCRARTEVARHSWWEWL